MVNTDKPLYNREENIGKSGKVKRLKQQAHKFGKKAGRKPSAKLAFVGLVALTVTLPQGAAFAADAAASSSTTTVIAESGPLGTGPAKAGATAADPSKAKITKEQAIAKVREWFPALEAATVSQVDYGVNNVYPAPSNQDVWTIQWQVEVGNGSYGFSSQVDAITGDLINTYIGFPREGNKSYYPPKVTREQALEKAKAFIAKAVPSLSADEVKESDSMFYADTQALFGPVNYSFNFSVLKNGLSSGFESIYITVTGDGEVMQFSRPGEKLDYPSSVPTVSKADAEKKFREEFQVELGYVPVYKNGVISDWVLAWGPASDASQVINAQTGRKIDAEGKEMTATKITYSDVPAGTKLFQPRTSATELTSDEAAKLVEQIVFIPEGRKLSYPNLDKDYQNPERKAWRLRWEEERQNLAGPFYFPAQTSATVDALTGQILEFQIESYNYGEPREPLAAPSGAVKLNYEQAKQRALEWVNQLYPQASRDLKLMERGESWSRLSNGEQFRFELNRYVNDIPVLAGGVSITVDAYGRLFYYSINRGEVPANMPDGKAVTVTAEQALKSYLDNYELELQYSQIGGYTIDNTYVEPKVYLVYSPQAKDPSKPFQVLNAVTGKWVTNFEDLRTEPAGNVEPKDLKGHWAEADLRTLVQYRILEPDDQGNLNPNESITVGDWLTYAVKAANPNYTGYVLASSAATAAGVPTDSKYSQVVSYAAELGWIDAAQPLQLDRTLTREQLAVLLTSMVKYDRLAANFYGKDALVDQFSDAKQITRPGEVAVAVQLGLLQGQNGKFNPQRQVTKAEAASILMRLVKLQGQTDQPIGIE